MPDYWHVGNIFHLIISNKLFVFPFLILQNDITYCIQRFQVFIGDPEIEKLF